MDNSQTVILNGYTIERANGRTVAVCLKPYLVVEGTSAEDAVRRMHDLFVAYADDAAQDGTLDVMLSRRAPAQAHLTYLLACILSAFSHSLARFTETFTIPQHA